MPIKWTMIRVSKELVGQLDAEIQRLNAAHQRGTAVGPELTESPQWVGPGVSRDSLIRWLLEFHRRQRDRGERYRKRKRKQ